MVLRILNLKGNKNCMTGSKVTTSLTTFFIHDYLRVFLLSGASLLWIMGSQQGRSVSVGVSDRLKVTCDRWKTI